MIRLYINGTEADLGTGGSDALLLFTYAAGDLDAPAVVQNAYSKEVVLPPTQRNAGLFGSASRPDKIRSSADTFDTLARTPFEIRSEAGEVLENGYCKLERASAADGYTLHLFGGLGDFLYGLMYGTDGNKKTLASLVYGNTASVDAGLSFNINAGVVSAAWARIATYPAAISNPYDVINFAPMHNGRPDGFDCNKGLVPVGTDYGCPGVTGYTGKGGYALVEFGRDLNEWEVRDLRSYLQRPIISTRAILDALTKAANNGGYTFDCDAVRDEWYARTWMTLPMLQVNDITTEKTTLSVAWSQYIFAASNTAQLAALSVSGTIPANGKVSATIRFTPTIAHAAWEDTPASVDLGQRGGRTYLFFRPIAYDSGGNPIAYGKVRCLCSAVNNTGAYDAMKHIAGTTPVGNDGTYTNAVFGNMDADSIEVQHQGAMTDNGTAATADPVALSLEGYGIASFGVAFACVTWIRGGHYLATPVVIGYNGVTEETAEASTATLGSRSVEAVAEAANRVRSGAYISKQNLMGSTASPAEFLLSFVKTFGLVLEYDAVARKVTLRERDAFYAAGSDIDLTARIDRSKGQPLTPNGIEAKWLRFAHGDPSGAFAETYASKYGAQYGAQRVNTGSPFNADTLEVLEGNIFKAGVTGLAYSRYFWLLYDDNVGDDVLPSPYLDNNCKYTLWKANGAGEQFDVKGITSAAQLSGINAVDEMSAPGYDGFFRVQLAGADGQATGDGAGILLFYNGRNAERCQLTDDTTAMLNANNGNPCWIPCLNDTAQLYVPDFTTYYFGRSWGGYIEDSLDMGMPRELDMPNMNYFDGVAIYDRRWKAYISDRYNGDAHRVTARVDLRGFQIGQALFANFYYFDGCWWVLEKISDWCWNNPAPVECTFVRVLDKAAYTNGQN